MNDGKKSIEGHKNQSVYARMTCNHNQILNLFHKKILIEFLNRTSRPSLQFYTSNFRKALENESVLREKIILCS